MMVSGCGILNASLHPLLLLLLGGCLSEIRNVEHDVGEKPATSTDASMSLGSVRSIQKKVGRLVEAKFMELGPIQLVTVGFDAPRLDGSILAALENASVAGHIRLIDAIGVYKNDDGTIVAAEATDLTEDEAIAYGAWTGALVGLGAGGVEGAEYGAIAGAVGAAEKYEYGLDNEELDAIAAAIPAGGAAMLLAIEHTWAIPLRNAAAASGGVMLSSEFLSTTTLIGLGVLAAE